MHNITGHNTYSPCHFQESVLLRKTECGESVLSVCCVHVLELDDSVLCTWHMIWYKWIVKVLKSHVLMTWDCNAFRPWHHVGVSCINMNIKMLIIWWGLVWDSSSLTLRNRGLLMPQLTMANTNIVTTTPHSPKQSQQITAIYLRAKLIITLLGQHLCCIYCNGKYCKLLIWFHCSGHNDVIM